MTTSQSHFSPQYNWACATLDVDKSESPARQLQALLRTLSARQFELTTTAADAFEIVQGRIQSRDGHTAEVTALRPGFIQHLEQNLGAEIEQFCRDYQQLSARERAFTLSSLTRRAGPLPALAERLDELLAIPESQSVSPPDKAVADVVGEALQAVLRSPCYRADIVRQTFSETADNPSAATIQAVQSVRQTHGDWAALSPQTQDALRGVPPGPIEKPAAVLDELEFVETVTLIDDSKSVAAAEFVEPNVVAYYEHIKRKGKAVQFGDVIVFTILLAITGPFLAIFSFIYIWFKLCFDTARYFVPEFTQRTLQEFVSPMGTASRTTGFINPWKRILFGLIFIVVAPLHLFVAVIAFAVQVFCLVRDLFYPPPEKPDEHKQLSTRADAVYADLPRDLQDELHGLMLSFETALAVRNPENLASSRADVEAFLARHSQSIDFQPRPE